jgi:hypothetical protein
MKERVAERAMLALSIASLALMAAIMFAAPPAPILSDYVEWVYHGVLLRDLLQNHPDPAYLLKPYPVPNSLTTLGLGTLMLLLPWKIAAKLWLVCGMSVGLACAYSLQKASAQRQGWQLPVITATALLGINFWCGFTNFLFGTYFAMLLCALLLREIQSRWAYAALLILTFFSHMIPLGFALLVVGLYAAQKRQWRLLWQTLPALGLSVWYFAGRAVFGDPDGKAGMVASVPYMSPLFAAFRVNTFLKCWGFVNLASTFHDSILLRLVGAKIFVLLFLLNAILATSLLWLLARSAWSAVLGKTGQRFFWLAVTIFFGVSLVMPEAAAGISDPGGRMLQVAVWCGLCVVAIRKFWTGIALAACAIVLLAFSCYQMAAVAEKPPMTGSTDGAIPAWMRQFGHVVYTDRLPAYDCIDNGHMDLPIYPTAMFLKRPAPK